MQYPDPSMVALLLHRVVPRTVPGADADGLVVLALRLPGTDIPQARRALHRILGDRLVGYCIGVDKAARHGICAHINLHRSELSACMGLLTAGMPQAEFGRVGPGAGAAGSPCVH
jgi:hypothetical protein